MVPANPAQGIGQVEEVRPAPKWLDKRGQYALLRAVQERGRQRDVALITLMLHTGLRLSEVAQLRVGDVRSWPSWTRSIIPAQTMGLVREAMRKIESLTTGALRPGQPVCPKAAKCTSFPLCRMAVAAAPTWPPATASSRTPGQPRTAPLKDPHLPMASFAT